MTPYYDIDICHFTADKRQVELLDQTLLPTEERYIRVSNAEEMAESIRKLQVRGAPLIGIAAAMGLAIDLRQSAPQNIDDFWTCFNHARKILADSRPTAANLVWALSRIEQKLRASKFSSVAEMIEVLFAEANLIKAEDVESCSKIGTYGKDLIKDGMGVLTHCNAGHLATGRYGTALSPIYFAHKEGKRFHVYADETRPLLQGARLTAFELQRSGIDVTLLCDNMAASLMAQGKIQLVLVGCDRVAANGDTANKIGTLSVALAAHHFGIPFYVCGPMSTFDSHCPTGEDIIIEQRDSAEVTEMWYASRMAPQGCKVYNPAFDVTPHNLITGYITEKGIRYGNDKTK